MVSRDARTSKTAYCAANHSGRLLWRGSRRLNFRRPDEVALKELSDELGLVGAEYLLAGEFAAQRIGADVKLGAEAQLLERHPAVLPCVSQLLMDGACHQSLVAHYAVKVNQGCTV